MDDELSDVRPEALYGTPERDDRCACFIDPSVETVRSRGMERGGVVSARAAPLLFLMDVGILRAHTVARWLPLRLFFVLLLIFFGVDLRQESGF